MEFKDPKGKVFIIGLDSINRIRLEFKAICDCSGLCNEIVLIESDWNLKTMTAHRRAWNSRVLIESDWNLKSINCDGIPVNAFVLIESDWNLKHVALLFVKAADISINRIRLEFKGRRECQDLSNKYGINRIRLEFKVTSGLTMKNEHAVLIESYWNLKSISTL